MVEKILILGNTRTKEEIILREVPFKTGDTITESQRKNLFTLTKNTIFNTGLFISVSVHTDNQHSKSRTIIIFLRERWYTYPIPIIELADRNFNEWWEQRGRDLSRLNFGIFLIQRNMRGRNETLKLKLQGGFTKKAELFYRIPYINKNKNSGIQLGISYILSRDVAYTLEDHRLVYLETEKNALTRFSAGGAYSHRHSLYNTSFAGATWNHNKVADTVSKLNVNYLGNEFQRYPSLFYRYESDHRDISYYPLNGFYWSIGTSVTGIGFLGDPDILEINGAFSYFKSFGKNFFLASSLSGKASLPKEQPFFNIRGLGYGNELVRGYELYVIPGQHYALTKNSFKYRIINRKKNITGLKPNEFNTIPLAVFLTINGDAGVVQDDTNIRGNERLSETLLFGGGPGIELVTYYDIVMRLEYSRTIHGDSGLFLHFGAAISGKARFY